MAGTDPGFDAGAFRDGIRFAMTLGAGVATEDQVVFHFPANLVYVGNVDKDGVPFDPNTTVQRVEPPTVQVPCAVEFIDAEPVPTNVGYLAPTRVKITVLDQEYAKIKGCSYVTIAGDRYDFRLTEPPLGLFDAGIYVLHFTAVNET